MTRIWSVSRAAIGHVRAWTNAIVVTKIKHVIVTIAVAFVMFGLLTWQVQARANANRNEAREAACAGFNVEQEGDRASALNNALVIFGLAQPGNLTHDVREEIVAKQDEVAQMRYRALEQQAALDNPFRVCTPDAISDFYSKPPPDPGATATTPTSEEP